MNESLLQQDGVLVSEKIVKLTVKGTKSLQKTRYYKVTASEKESKTCLLIVPGNPGISEFYIHTAIDVAKSKTIDVFIVTAVGFDAEIERSEPFKRVEVVLEGQIQHKIAFIEQVLGNYEKIHVAGHSVGSYILLEAFSKDENNNPRFDKNFLARIGQVFLLAPTFERFADTPNAEKLPFLVKWLNVIIFLPFLLGLIPGLLYFTAWFHTFLHFKTSNFSKSGQNFESCYFRAILKLANYKVVYNLIHMADYEYKEIVSRPSSITLLSSRIHALYCENDGWAPEKFYHDMVKDFPKMDIVFKNNVKHAWCVDQTENSFVANFIISRLPK